MAALLLLVLLTARVVLCPDPSLLEEARELSELPLDKLLHVKQAFTAPAPDTEEQPTRTVDGGGEGPEAMALTRGDVTALTSKDKSSTPTVFQGTVTTLAFLAFGGYILCLAVSAARSKSDSARGMWNTPGGGGGKGRRHRRDAMPGAEDMMLALTTLAEGYATFHATPSP